MQSNKLSELAIRNAKPRDATYSLVDGEGMYLEVTPKGGKWWRLNFRFNGKQKRISLGTYPDTSLKDAREKRKQARELLTNGIDPAEQRKARKTATETARRNTFEGVASEWAEHKVLSEKWTPRTERKRRGWLDNGLVAHLGHRPIAEITTPELWDVLKKTQATSGYTANRLRGIAVEIFNYAIATGRASANPAVPLQGQITVKRERHRLAILDPTEIGQLLRDIEACTAHPCTKAAARLAPLLFVRPGELRFAEWSEIDLKKAEWSIPADKMKMREPHLVPLSRQAVEILMSLKPLTGHSRYVFEGIKGKPYSENTLNKLFETMGYKGKMTQHGWRAVARTFLDEILDFRVDWIEHQLAHSVKDANGRAYNRTSHLEGRVMMMQAWADYLDSLKGVESTPTAGTKAPSTAPADQPAKSFTSAFERHHKELLAKQGIDHVDTSSPPRKRKTFSEALENHVKELNAKNRR